MANYGNFAFMHSMKLYTRSCLMNRHQVIPKTVLKSLKESVFLQKPKKPQTAFFLYLSDIRSRMVKENSQIKQSDLLRKASKEWADIPPAAKEQYQQRYNTNYKIYVEELKQYNENLTDEQKQLFEKKKQEYKELQKHSDYKKKKEEFGRPKRPATAYIMFLLQKKGERNPNTPFNEWMKLMPQEWNNLPQEEKQHYYNQATENLAKYQKDLEEWEMKMIQMGHFDMVRQKTLQKHKQIQNEKIEQK